MKEVWMELEANMEKCNEVQYCRLFGELTRIRKHLQESKHRPMLLAQFHALLFEFSQTVKISPEQVRIMRLSSPCAINNSLYAFEWRVGSLGDGGFSDKERSSVATTSRSEQIEIFVSGVSNTFFLLRDLKSNEERSAFLRNLKTATQNRRKYTSDQIEVIQKAYDEISSNLENEGDLTDLTPERFIPWYELIVDKWNCLGEGGFGSVYRVKWLDSDAVVKQVFLTGVNCKTDTPTSYSSLSAPENPSTIQAKLDTTEKEKALAMFRYEVDIWFGFSHPHIVRLFGACHVGIPFFVCEYATNGTLVS